MQNRLGVNCALSTPFNDEGEIDLAQLVEHSRWVLSNGADGLTLFGTTGEGASLSLRERYAALGAATAGGLDMKRRVIAGVTSSTIDDSVLQARAAYDMGCRGILITPPFFFPEPSEAGLFTFFATVFERLGGSLRDVFLYHIPAMTRSMITSELVARLRREFGDAIVGIKDSSGDWGTTASFLAQHSNDIQVLVGSEIHCARAVRQGGSGTICGLANVRPDILRKAAWDGEDVDLIASYRSAILPNPFPASLKAIIARRTGVEGWSRMRAPNRGLNSEQAAALFERVDQTSRPRVLA